LQHHPAMTGSFLTRSRLHSRYRPRTRQNAHFF
jgi:hypothetical protein